jgi:hypothetical protein
MSTPPVILMLSGSLRADSSNESVLRTAYAVAPDARIGAVLHDGLGELPHFNPDNDTDPLPVPVVELRAAIERAAGVLICTPEYAGTLPGSFKNLLTGAAIVEPACVKIPVDRGMPGADGFIADAKVRRQLGEVLGLLVAAGPSREGANRAAHAKSMAPTAGRSNGVGMAGHRTPGPDPRGQRTHGPVTRDRPTAPADHPGPRSQPPHLAVRRWAVTPQG